LSGEPRITFEDALGALRRRWPLILAIALVVVGAALAVSLTSQKQYDATAQLLVVENDPANAVVSTAAPQATPDPQREVNTAAAMVKQTSIADSVRGALSLSISTQALLNKVSTSSDSANSNLLKITAEDSSPTRAATIANQFARQYLAFRLALARQNFQQGANRALSQFRSLSPAQAGSTVGQQLQTRAKELQIDSALQTGGVQLVSNATVPTGPASPKPVLDGAVGLVVGLLLGTGAALGLELFDRRFKTEAEIERGYGLPVLAAIPRAARREAARGDGQQREAYGLLAATLEYSAAGDRNKVLMVTSAIPGEGKTSVTLGLAKALARKGTRVMAVEADLRRPMFDKYLGLEPTGGLARVLLEPARLTEEVIWLDVQTLLPLSAAKVRRTACFAVLPAGPPLPNPQHALGRRTMGHVLQAAGALVDIVVIDSSPLGTVSDAAALDRLVDDVLIVGQVNVSTRDGARRLMRVLQNSSMQSVGLVVLGTDLPAGDYGYYPARQTAGAIDQDGAVDGTGARVGAKREVRS